MWYAGAAPPQTPASPRGSWLINTPCVSCVPLRIIIFFFILKDTLIMSFISARYALLTYAQCGDLDPFAIVDHLSALGAECIIGRESHADSGTHLHAFVDFGRKFRSRRSDIFDVNGFHPNLSSSYRNPAGGYDYAIKDGDVVAGGLERPPTTERPEKQNNWHEIIMAETREEFFESARRLDPRALVTSFSQLEKYADWRYRVDPEQYRHNPEHHFDTGRYPELDEWAGKYVDWDASVSGESRWGCVGLYRTLRRSVARGLPPPFRQGEPFRQHTMFYGARWRRLERNRVCANIWMFR